MANLYIFNIFISFFGIIWAFLTKKYTQRHTYSAYNLKKTFWGQKMNSTLLTGTVCAVANGLAQNLSLSELTLLAAVFVQIGDTLATIAAERALLEERKKE